MAVLACAVLFAASCSVGPRPHSALRDVWLHLAHALESFVGAAAAPRVRTLLGSDRVARRHHE